MSDFRVGDIVQLVDQGSIKITNPIYLDGKPPKRKFRIIRIARVTNKVIGGKKALDFAVLLDLVTSKIHDAHYPIGGVPVRMLVKVPGIIQFVNQKIE